MYSSALWENLYMDPNIVAVFLSHVLMTACPLFEMFAADCTEREDITLDGVLSCSYMVIPTTLPL